MEALIFHLQRVDVILPFSLCDTNLRPPPQTLQGPPNPCAPDHLFMCTNTEPQQEARGNLAAWKVLAAWILAGSLRRVGAHWVGRARAGVVSLSLLDERHVCKQYGSHWAWWFYLYDSHLNLYFVLCVQPGQKLATRGDVVTKSLGVHDMYQWKVDISKSRRPMWNFIPHFHYTLLTDISPRPLICSPCNHTRWSLLETRELSAHIRQVDNKHSTSKKQW